MSSVLEVVQAVRVVDALKRKPKEFKTVSFFGEYDVWRYHAVFDKKLCDKCLKHAETFYFIGKYLRGLFEHLEIKDINTILVKEHPHCRCELHRITDPAEYLMITRELFR